MTLEIHTSTAEWILKKMEEITKSVMTNSSVWESEIIIKKLGEFQALKELLDNADYESYGIEFKIKFPTKKIYGEKSQ